MCGQVSLGAAALLRCTAASFMDGFVDVEHGVHPDAHPVYVAPATGSMHPLLSLAGALVQAGHQVAFCSSRSFRPDIEAMGFDSFEVGLDWNSPDGAASGLGAVGGG